MDRKTELKFAYKQTPRPVGVIQIKNCANGKLFIGSSTNAEGLLNRHQFELKRGAHRNKAMQQDWNEYGSEHFSFEIIECLEPNDDPQYDYREDLAVLEELWLEKLQPYGENGYNIKKRLK